MQTFRSILKKKEKKGKTKLYSKLKEIENAAQENWINHLGHKYGSYNGMPHLKGVEKHLDDMVPFSLKKSFNATEIFLLLSAVYLHDIGKIFEGGSHSNKSSIYIQKKWYFLKIPSKEIGRLIAILTCSHCWSNPLPPKCTKESDNLKCSFNCVEGKPSELDVLHESPDGNIRLKWLAALLRVADEVDNHFPRAVPEELEEDINKLSWRRYVNSIIFDKEGKCIKFRMNSLENLEPTVYDTNTGLPNALIKLNDVLFNWSSPLKEMDIVYEKAFVEVSLPCHALIAVDAIILSDFTKNSNAKIKCILEPAFDSIIKERHLLNTMINLKNSLIDKKTISWESLAEETGYSDVQLVRKATIRLNNIIGCKGSRYNYLNTIEYGEIKNLIVSESGWNLEFNENDTDAASDVIIDRKDHSIKTHIDKLDELLFPDDDDAEVTKRGGFAVYKMNNNKLLTPIIAIAGSSGEGKTTLSLQIASNLVSENADEYCCVYYSLEQEPARIIQQLANHSFLPVPMKNYIINLENVKYYLKKDYSNKILFPRLSPKPVDMNSISHEQIFNERFDELRLSVKKIKNEIAQKEINLFYFIDSLTAFSYQSLTRTEINRIFSLFRNEEIPLIITLEQKQHWAVINEETHYHHAKYLADVVIQLFSLDTDNYYRQTIEIAKSRYNRRILGKHLMKLKSKDNNPTDNYDSRHGVVIYPSIHYHLVSSRVKKESSDEFAISIPNEMLPIASSSDGNQIFIDSCIVICGEHGGHKLALGINILLRTGNIESKNKRKLIISFSEEKDINLNGIALFQELNIWRGQLEKFPTSASPEGKKVWESNIGNKENGKIYITILNFRLGQIMPEEFFYILNEYLNINMNDKEVGANEIIDSVLVATTAQIHTGFPFLNKEPLFFPVLVDMLKCKGLFSIFVDVYGINKSPEASLQSAADCRVFVERDNIGKNILTVENVRGKNYDRDPREFKIGADKKTLILDKI